MKLNLKRIGEIAQAYHLIKDDKTIKREVAFRLSLQHRKLTPILDAVGEQEKQIVEKLGGTIGQEGKISFTKQVEGKQLPDFDALRQYQTETSALYSSIEEEVDVRIFKLNDFPEQVAPEFFTLMGDLIEE